MSIKLHWKFFWFLWWDWRGICGVWFVVDALGFELKKFKSFRNKSRLLNKCETGDSHGSDGTIVKVKHSSVSRISKKVKIWNLKWLWPIFINLFIVFEMFHFLFGSKFFRYCRGGGTTISRTRTYRVQTNFLQIEKLYISKFDSLIFPSVIRQNLQMLPNPLSSYEMCIKLQPSLISERNTIIIKIWQHFKLLTRSKATESFCCNWIS
jgi:hypothetical protein